MMNDFDKSFLDFFDTVIEDEVKEESQEEISKYDIKFKYRSTKRISFKDIPEGLLKVLAVDTGVYEYHSVSEIPDLLIRKYELKRV